MTRFVLLPVIVKSADGPVIVVVPTVLVSLSWPDFAMIVCGVAKTVGSKVIVDVSSGDLVGEIDGLGQAHEAGARGEGVARRIHDHATVDQANVGQVERNGRTPESGDDDVTPGDVIGRGRDGGFATEECGRGGRECGRGPAGCGVDDEGDEAGDRLGGVERVVRCQGHAERKGELRADER